MLQSDGRYRKTRQAVNSIGDAHELTFSCYRGIPILGKDRVRQWFLESLDVSRKRHGFELWAYVIMPEHAHVLVMPSEKGSDIEGILKAIKQPVSQKAMSYLREVQPSFLSKLEGRMHRGQREYHLWQPGGGYDRNVIASATAWKMLEYIHQNPVRRKLVDRAVDWRWSSARFYEGLGEYDLEMDGKPPD